MTCFSRHGGRGASVGAEMFFAVWLLCCLRCVIFYSRWFELGSNCLSCRSYESIREIGLRLCEVLVLYLLGM